MSRYGMRVYRNENISWYMKNFHHQQMHSPLIFSQPVSPPSIISPSLQLGQLSAANVSAVAARRSRPQRGYPPARPPSSLGGRIWLCGDAARPAGDVWRRFLAADHVQQYEVDLAGTLGAVHIASRSEDAAYG